MSLVELRLENFRNIAESTLRPGGGASLLVGRNGAGKTAVLEAVYFLARGRSFRSAEVRALVRSGEREMAVFARLRERLGGEHRIGVGWDGKERQIRVDGKDERKVSTVAGLVPISVLVPQSHEILDRGPDVRRRLLDWGVFHVEPGYGEEARRYKRALGQRNRALKVDPRHAGAWEGVLGELGERLQERRIAYLKGLNEELAGVAGRLCGESVRVDLRRGWPEGRDGLAGALGGVRAEDLARGYTSLGPHRADLEVYLGGRRADRFGSRGQQKLVIASIILSQARTVERRRRTDVLLLVDDFGAELDRVGREHLWREIETVGCQTLVTATDASQIPGGQNLTVFHVEQGRVCPA